MKKRANALDNKVIVITGASSGIGKEVAVNLAHYNVKLVLIARRKAKLYSTMKEAKKNGAKVISIVGDIREKYIQDKIFNDTLKEFRTIDVFINNAGLGKASKFEIQDEQEIDEMIQTNLISVMKLTQKAIEIMKKQGKGHIINISSGLAFIPVSPLAVYCATKAAIGVFDEALREELKKYNIKLTTIFPGPFKTEFSEVANIKEEVFGGQDVKIMRDNILKAIEKPKDRIIIPTILRIGVEIIYRVPILKSLMNKKFSKMIYEGMIEGESKTKKKEHDKIKEEKPPKNTKKTVVS